MGPNGSPFDPGATVPVAQSQGGPSPFAPQGGGPQMAPGAGAWGSGSLPGSGGFTSTGAPVKILIGTYGGALAGLILAVLGKGLPLLVTGWLLASIVALAFAMVYTVRNAQLQSNPFYVYRSGPKFFYIGGITFSLLAIVACAAQIALHIGRTW